MKMSSADVTIKKFHELSVDELYDILKLRSAVFVVEQTCIYQDLDDKDQKAVHLYFRDGGEIVASARIVDKGVVSPYVTIGRVVTKERLKGYGRIILEAALSYIRENTSYREAYIMAQTQAMPFYERLGFQAYGEEFMEDGIPHRHMLLKL